MSLEVGSRLGHYNVTALIGEGGMGQVYQATDTKLNRQVALKILPEAFATDPDRLARFQREAQVLASLNHPNIAAIHGLEESEGTRALVLELVEGPTLADRIAQGAIPLDEALPIAKQIAEALEAAHEASVIHRDLKPANIKVRDDGMVKVLDFGLAKALDTTPEGDPSQSPTLTAAATQMGVIMGTAAYMSPEQARGKPTDRRADIWSFGVVLFEMLTGQRAFAGEDVSVTLANVINQSPDWKRLPGGISPSLHTYLQRCLDKDVTKRVQAIGDVRLVMEGAFETTVGASSEPPAAKLQVWQRPIPLAVAGLALLVVGGFTVGTVVEPPAVASPPARFELSLPFTDQLQNNGLALSPDGQDLVYVASRDDMPQLFHRAMGALDALPMQGTEGAALPFFSPDGVWVGFFADNSLKKVLLAGGPATTLTPALRRRAGASWGTDGTILFASDAAPRVMRVREAGGEAQPVTTGDNDSAHQWLDSLPDGKGVLFTMWSGALDTARMAVQTPGMAEPMVLVQTGTFPKYVPTGHIVFARANSLWAMPFDLERLTVTGEPKPVVDGVHVNIGGFAQFAVADDGTLAYIPSGGGANSQRQLVWVDREGIEEPLDQSPQGYEEVRVSPDGRHVAATIMDQGNRDIWIVDTERGTTERLTSHPSTDAYPSWTPDGRQIAFYSAGQGGAGGIFWRSAEGTDDPERLSTGSRRELAWAPSGRQLLFRDLDGRNSLGVLDLDDGSSQTLVGGDGTSHSDPAVSPDGRWLAYESNQTGESEVWVRPFPDVQDDRQRMSVGGGSDPVWSWEGSELFFRSDQTMLSVAVTDGPPSAWGRPVPLFEADEHFFTPPHRAFDVGPDDRFLMIREDVATATAFAEQDRIILVQDWFQELTERVPVP